MALDSPFHRAGTEDIGLGDLSSVDVRLDSWKEIAAYLKRDVTTVRRWEKREGLPVHRHLHDRRDSVYAFAAELDQWWHGRAGRLAENGIASGAARGDRHIRSLIAVLAVVLLSGAALVIVLRRPTQDAAHVRFAIVPPDGATFGSIRLSPDGRHVAFTAAREDGSSFLWVRPLDSLTATLLKGTDGAAFPFWSPDSRTIGFFGQGKLRTIGVGGGEAKIVCDAPSGRGGTWSRDGVILFAPGNDSALLRVQASGGTAVPATRLEGRERGHMWPEFLPDGRHFLYLADSAHVESHGVYVAESGAPGRRLVLRDATNATWRDDYLLFARDRRLIAQPFDSDRNELSGEPVTIAESVRERFDAEHLFEFSTSSTGVLAYRPMASLETRLVWRDRSAGVVPIDGAPALFADPTLSPDGRWMAVDVFDPRPSPRVGFGLGGWTADIWLFSVPAGTASRLTFDPAADFEPVWSPDGARIVFSSNRGGSLDLYAQDTAGGVAELLLKTPSVKHALSWSPDGNYILYASLETKTGWDLWMLPTFGDRTPVPLLQTEFNEHQAVVSRDGRWIAYTSNETGRNEVYVRSFPPREGKWQISTTGGGDARWGPDGQELFYIAEDRRLWSLAVRGGAAFEPGVARPLFDTGNRPGWSVARNHYDVSRDGRRFLVMAPVEDDRRSPMIVVLNWAAMLK